MAKSKAVVAKPTGVVAALNADQTLKASTALLSHLTKAAAASDAASTKKNLLQDDDDADIVAETPIWLTLTTKRHVVEKTKLKPAKIPLPHSLNDNEHGTICLITADPQRAYKDIVDSDDFPRDLAKRITRVVDVGKLRAKFSAYEAQRKLFSEHDVFLADDRIVSRLPKIIGKTFYKSTQKRPIPVVLSAKEPKAAAKARAKAKAKAGALAPKKKKAEGEVNAGTAADVAKDIQKALGCALVSLSASANVNLRVAYAGWTPEQVAANVETVATALVEKHVPDKWANVKSIYIKGPESAALPIWLTDELWLSGADVVANDDPRALQSTAEKANVGKKRKAAGGEDDADVAAEAEQGKPSKKAKATKKALPDGDDGKLDAQISDRKLRLRKQKATATKAMED